MEDIILYEIVISAVSKRRQTIAKEIIEHASNLYTKIQPKENYDSGGKTFLTFESKEWRPFEVNDLSYRWYNDQRARGIYLLEGEKVDLLCIGKNEWGDICYRIVATKGAVFRQEAKVKFANKRKVCELDDAEEGYKCSGCGCCCDLEREFFALPSSR